MDTLTVISAGFSLVAGPLLLLMYLISPAFPYRHRYSVTAAVILTTLIAVLQAQHLLSAMGDYVPMDRWVYLGPLFLAPGAFYWFGRAVVFPDAGFTPFLVLHFVPVLLPLLLPLSWALPPLFALGVGYAIYLSWKVYLARHTRRQQRFERSFSAAMVISALLVFGFGITLPWIDSDYFVVIYATSAAFAYAMIVFALIAIPDFVDELFAAIQARYSQSKLAGIDKPHYLSELNRLMEEEQLYQQEDLNLAGTADAVGLTSHQLSELINTELGMSFSQFVRRRRVQAAEVLLTTQPEQSVLAISLEVGFRSQSNFYTAFKAVHGVSPGHYRRTTSA